MARRSSRIAGALLTLVALLLAACSPAQPTQTSKEAPPAPGSSTPSVTTKKLTIGMVIPHRTNPFWVNWAKAATQAADSLGVTFKLVDYENREEKQIDTIQGVLSSGVDGLIVVPHNTQMGPGVLDLVAKNKVPLMMADRWPGISPTDSGKYLAFIGVNDEQMGYDITKALLAQGCTKLVANNGVRGHSGYESRTKGRQQATTEDGKVQVVREEWAQNVRSKGTEIMEAWLTAMPGPGFDCLYGGNDDWSMGAWKVLEDRGVANKVKIAGLDLIPEVVEKLKTGEFAVSGGGHWFEGAFGVLLMHDYLNGVNPPSELVLMRAMVITKDQAAAFEEQFYTNPVQIDWKAKSRFLNPNAKPDFSISMK